MISAPLLQYPNFQKRFISTTDASDYAIGAILSQGQENNDLLIAYANRILNDVERNYSVIEKGALGIVWACKHFRPFLMGPHFNIYTEQRSLTQLFNIENPGSRITRWKFLLAEFDYIIHYKPGRKTKMLIF